MAGKVVVTVRAAHAEEVPITVAFETPYGSKSRASVACGANAVHAFTTRLVSVPEAAASAELSATIDDESVSTENEAPYPARTCN